MVSMLNYFNSKIESFPVASKNVATAFYYSYLIPKNHQKINFNYFSSRKYFTKKFCTLSVLIITLLIFCPKTIKSQQLQQLLDDDKTNFTDIGEIRLLITNFGIFGSSFNQWPSIPSCEYPANSWIEHLFIGGLWVGCNKSNDSIGTNSTGPFVTVGAYDENVLGGNGEFTTNIGDTIVQRSSLVNSTYYSPSAISHQDFLMNYSDTSLYRLNGEPIYDHTPIGISINQESYCWNFNYANAFVIMNYWVKNISNKYLTNIYIGIWSDAVLGKGRPVGSSAFNKGGNAFIDSLKLGYEFDWKSDSTASNSYYSVKFLGSSIYGDSVNYVSWKWRDINDPNFFSPINDVSKFHKMQGYFDIGENIRYGQGIDPEVLKQPANRSFLLSYGKINYLKSFDSVNVVYAIICANKYGNEPSYLDLDSQKINLYYYSLWAQKCYNGEDINGNGLLDVDEDLDGDGKITRYIFTPYLTDIEDESQLPTEFALMHNYPNPFNPSTMISYQIPVASNVTLKVYDILGNEVATLVDEYKHAGSYNVQFTMSNLRLSSGVYFYQLKAGQYIETKKMLLLK